MDITRQGIITLLKSAVTGKSYPLPEGFDLDEALKLIRRHHMHALCCEGALRCGVDRKSEAMRSLLGGYVSAVRISEGQLAELSRITAAFRERQIDYMLLKGSRMKHLYPKPELRGMGDADVLIRMEQYAAVRAVMQELGFREEGETDHELIWKSDKLFLELHKRLIPSYNKDYYAFYGDGWQLATRQENGWVMEPEDEWVYLFAHFAKHYRDGGIGCRHVVDLWVFLRAHPELDEKKIRADLQQLQLWEFHENIRALIAYWFEDGAGSDKLEYLTEFIFASGSWGDMQTHTLSIAVRDSKRSRLQGKLRYILRTAFPSVEILRGKYTVLKKRPWLLPLVWLWRPVYKLLFERDSLESKRRDLQAYDSEQVEQRRRLLNYVGLDYNFS